MLELEAESESTTPTWISFADLMTGLLGAFVLLLVGVVLALLFQRGGGARQEGRQRQVRAHQRRAARGVDADRWPAQPEHI